MKIDRKMRETVAGMLLQEMLSLNSDRGIPTANEEDKEVDHLDGPYLAELLEKNFKRIDINGDGISRKELAFAMSAPQHFSKDEYAMLRLLSKYFHSIAAICDDQAEGEPILITKMDLKVLVQFLKHSNMTLRDIHDWLALNERSVAPPPSSSADS